MNTIQRISHDLRTERLAQALGLGNWRRLEPAEIRERWWRLRAMQYRGVSDRARRIPEEASSFRFHSME